MTVAGGSFFPATSATAAACTLMLSVRAPGRAPSDSMATIRLVISRRSASNSAMRARADLAGTDSAGFLNGKAMVFSYSNHGSSNFSETAGVTENSVHNRKARPLAAIGIDHAGERMTRLVRGRNVPLERLRDLGGTRAGPVRLGRYLAEK